MNPTTASEVFFIISSVGFVTLWVLIVVFLFYLIRAMKMFSRMLERVEKNVDSISDTTKEMIEDVRESTVYRFLFKKKRKGRKDNKNY